MTRAQERAGAALCIVAVAGCDAAVREKDTTDQVSAAQIDISPDHDCPQAGSAYQNPPPYQQMNTCFRSCRDWGHEREWRCRGEGYRPQGGTSNCLQVSQKNPTWCAGVVELCYERNKLPDGRPAVPPQCYPPRTGFDATCATPWRACEDAWLDHQYGNRTMRNDCWFRTVDEETSCYQSCVRNGYVSGIRCNARNTDPPHDPSVDGGNLEPDGQCVNRTRTVVMSCTAARSVECEFRPPIP